MASSSMSVSQKEEESDSDYDYSGDETNKILPNIEENSEDYESSDAESESSHDGRHLEINFEKVDQFLKGDMTFNECTKSSDTGKSVGSRPSETVRKRIYLTPVLKSLIGLANLACARQNYDEAFNFCLEVIKEAPYAPEPFITLAEIYDLKGFSEKSLHCALIAANLSPSQSDWVHLAQLCLEQNDKIQAINCYGKAIKRDINNIELYTAKAKLQEEVNDIKGMYNTYHRMVEKLTPDHGLKILEYAQLTAKYYHQNAEQGVMKAKEIMEIAFKKVPNLVSESDIHLMLELMISLKEYFNALEIITHHFDVIIEAEEDILADENTTPLRIISCQIPDIPIQIRVQLTVVFIHIGAFHLLPELIGFFESMEDFEQYGDLYMDIVEALMIQNRHGDSIQLLKILLSSEAYRQPVVWLSYADCLRMCDKIDEAISAYMEVTKLAPQHIEARLQVAELLNTVKRNDEAVSVLQQDLNLESWNAQLLYEACILLKEMPGREEELIMYSRLLFANHCLSIKGHDELLTLSKIKLNSKSDSLRRLQDPTDKSTITVPCVEEEFELFKHVCSVLCKRKQFALLEELIFSACGSNRFYNPHQVGHVRRSELSKLLALACYFNRDYLYGTNVVKDLTFTCANDTSTWNIMGLMFSLVRDQSKYAKYVIRCLSNTPDHKPLTILHANMSLSTGSFKYSLNEYLTLFRKEPNAYYAFMIGLSLLQLAGSKSSSKQNSLVSQCISYFMQYKKLRCSSMQQEVYYNQGRMYHQLGLLANALHNYQKVLTTSSELIEQYPHLIDLKREAAFNMSLIYQATGSSKLASKLIEDYIVI